MNAELTAAYERIDELERTLRSTRNTLSESPDPFDVIDTAVAAIDDALDDRLIE